MMNQFAIVKSLSTLGVLTFCLCCLFIIPYHVPQAPGGVSVAYAFGWNSKAGWLLLILTSSAFALYSKGFGLALPPEQLAGTGRHPLPRWTLTLSLFITSFCCLYQWWWSRTFTAGLESQYFLGSYQSYFLGGHIYKTFDFFYGPVMFYLTIWVNALFPRLYHGDAYFLSWTLQWLVGLVLLWKVVQLSLRSRERAAAVFFVLASFNFLIILSLGEQYTPLRVIVPIYLALIVERAYRQEKPLYLVFGVAALGGVGALLYTPEAGVQFFIGTILFFSLCLRSGRHDRTGIALLGFSVVMLSAFYLAYRCGEFDLAIKTASGGINYPLVFGLDSLIPILIVFCGASVFVSSARKHQLDDPFVYLLLLSLAAVPAAMGRCDPGHILLNTMSTLIVVLVVLNQYKRIFIWTAGFLIAFFLSLLAPVGYRVKDLIGTPLMRTVMLAGSHRDFHTKAAQDILFMMWGKTGTAERIALLRQDAIDDERGISLPSNTRLLAPLGAPLTVKPLAGGVIIEPGFFPGVMPVSKEFFERKVYELQRDPATFLVLPDHWDATCVATPKSLRDEVRFVFGPSIIPTVRNVPMNLLPLCGYLNEHYLRTEYASPLAGTLIYQPKGH